MGRMSKILFAPDGTSRFIHDDNLADIAREIGPLVIRRASHVEPTHDGQWIADLSPVGGPRLGPYSRRQVALAAERDWIEANDVPFPRARTEAET